MTRGLPLCKLDRSSEYINAHLNRNLSLLEVATELNMSQYYFCRLFKQSLGLSPHQYLIQQRVERSKQLLRHSQDTIFDIASIATAKAIRTLQRLKSPLGMQSLLTQTNHKTS